MPKRPLPADSAAQKTNSKKVKVVITRTRKRGAPPASLASTPAQSTSSASYPWDSHQDDIVVNSVETRAKALRTGVEHYQHQLSLQKDYEQICTDFEEYRGNGLKESGSPYMDEQHDAIEKDQHADDEKRDYTKPPTPPSLMSAYEYQIYTCTTINPAIFLAITRIAQRNLPFINFESAINHLPNLSPASPQPKLQRGVLAENIAFERRRGIDVLVVILFFPLFYHDGRHAVGYYVSSAPARRSSPTRQQICVQDAKQMVFTPCTLNDLEMYGLITYADDRGVQKSFSASGEWNERVSIQSVGVKGGRWIGCDTKDAWDEWKDACSIVGDVWEKRLETTRLEDLNL